MAIIPLTKADNPILRAKAKKIYQVDAGVSRLIDDMQETLRASKGVGLAAPQIGVSLRLAIVQLPEDEDDPMAGQLIVLINPEIVKSEGEYTTDEGCLSLPGYVGKVCRASGVTVKALDRHGKAFKIKATGLMAEALQHEVDHLNGTLFFDRLAVNEVLRPVRSNAAEGL